jgi:hypothetical protein
MADEAGESAIPLRSLPATCGAGSESEAQMKLQQISFIVCSGVSALAFAFLLGYSAHDELGLSRDVIRFGALLAALIIGTVVAIDYNLSKIK